MSGRDEIPFKRMVSELTFQIKAEIKVKTMNIYASWEDMNNELNIESAGQIERVTTTIDRRGHYRMLSLHGEESYRKYLVDKVKEIFPVLAMYMTPRRNSICLLLFELPQDRWIAMGAIRRTKDND